MAAFPAVTFDRFYTHDDLTAFLHACKEAAGGLMQLESLTRTPEGREVWLAAVTDPATGGPETKPAYYVQANIHAHEMYGTSAALHFLHTLLTAPDARQMLADTTFYVVPRTNPDGAEMALSSHSDVRSRREEEPRPNGIIPQDLNGDGMILNMRWEDPAGPLAVDPEDDRLLVPRRPGDNGPFYHQCTEGLIHEYDGGPVGRSVRDHDFNRNYPMGWDRSTDLARYPLEHPETRAVADFLFAHPNVFGGIDFHGGTPALLHPSSIPGSEMSEADLGLILEIGRMGEPLTGFRLMDQRDYRASWARPSSLPGSSNGFAHFGLGISWYVIEVGWGLSTAGIGPDESFDALSETRERDFMRRILRFADERAGEDTRVLFVPWEEYDHPQLGKVQIGGLTRAATAHVFPPQMEEISTGTTRFLLRHAGYRPRLALSGCEVTALEGGLYRLRARVANVGRLATNVMSTGLASRAHRPVQVTLEDAEGLEVLSRRRTLEFPSLAGGGAFQPLEWFIFAPAGSAVTLRASHPRGGTCTRDLRLP